MMKKMYLTGIMPGDRLPSTFGYGEIHFTEEEMRSRQRMQEAESHAARTFLNAASDWANENGIEDLDVEVI